MPCQDTHTHARTHARTEQCKTYLCFLCEVQPSFSTLLSSSFPFSLAGCHTTIGHSRLLPEPLKPQRNISSQETNDSQKLQKTLQPLLGNRFHLGPKGGRKTAAFAEGGGLVRDQRPARVRSRGEAKTLCAPSRRCHCLSGGQTAHRWVLCWSGILAQCIAWMLKLGMDIWNRSVDEPK